MLPFFRRRRAADRVSTGFRWFQGRLFADAVTPAYFARARGGRYELQITKSSYFAWELASLSVALSDFVLDARIEIDGSNAHSAVGFVVRYLNEENFYSFLVSNRGMYRFDLLFNKHPMPLIEWTSLTEKPEGGAGEIPLRIVGHGSHFSFYVDEEWVGEIEDETIPAGTLGFAAQNFSEAERAVFSLKSFAVEARPLVVEREYLRWVHYVPHSPAVRLALAETLFAMGNFGAAAVQLRRALAGREGTARERFLLAECYLRLSLIDAARAEIEEVLRREPAHRDALFEKANLLYLSNEFLATRDYIRDGLAAGTLEPSASLWDLLGNAEYSLGNWQKSGEAYTHAMELQPEEPLFLKNAARSLELAGRREEALETYMRAARILFRDQAYDELTFILPRVLVLDPSNAEARALEAKMLFHEGKSEEALGILKQLASSGIADSAVYYLLGIILSEKGLRQEAVGWLAKAAEMEPTFPLYHFRLAEGLHLLGRDPREVLERARSLAPDDPWINNLSGLVFLEAGEGERAEAVLRAAHQKAPSEIDIRMNLSEALTRSGKHEEALALLDDQGGSAVDDARLANQKGNILGRRGDFTGAVEAYEKAIHLDAAIPIYKENCASACLELDMVHRAEELLGAVEQASPSPSVYNLLGNAARLKGEPQRAELAYAKGLGMDPGNPDLTANLAMLQMERGRHAEAKSLIESILEKNQKDTRALALLEKMRARFETRLACSGCGREWWVPRDIPFQPSLVVRGDPPPEAPAGRCPRCGKLFCVACASAHLKDMRFHCADCGEPLKLSDDSLRFLLSELVEKQKAAPIPETQAAPVPETPPAPVQEAAPAPSPEAPEASSREASAPSPAADPGGSSPERRESP